MKTLQLRLITGWNDCFFSLPILRALLPSFSTNCPGGSHFAQMGSHFQVAHNATTNPCSLLSLHKPLYHDVICTYTNHPQTHPKTPLFLSWTWKWAKWTTVWAKWTPTGQNVWKKGKTFLELGKKNDRAAQKQEFEQTPRLTGCSNHQHSSCAKTTYNKLSAHYFLALSDWDHQQCPLGQWSAF